MSDETTSSRPVALVTGGNSGIGFAIATALAKAGYDLMLVGRHLSRLETAKEILRRTTRVNVEIFQADVSQGSFIDKLVLAHMQAFARIDVLVNNAGIFRLASLEKTTEADWDQILETDLKAPFLLTQAFIPFMVREKSGYIFNVSSLLGHEGLENCSAYCSAKAGLLGLTRVINEEYNRHGIKATALCPGLVHTPMTENMGIPTQEMIHPDDLGTLCVALLSLSAYTRVPEVILDRMGTE